MDEMIEIHAAHFAQDISEILPAQLQCLEKGGDSTTKDDTTTQGVQLNRSEASEGIGSKDTNTRTISDIQSPMKVDEKGPQGFNQSTVTVPEGNLNKQQRTIKEATPVAF
jgi:hypothetical protein